MSISKDTCVNFFVLFCPVAFYKFVFMFVFYGGDDFELYVYSRY